MSFVYLNNRNKSYIFKDFYFSVDNRLRHALFLFLPVKSDFTSSSLHSRSLSEKVKRSKKTIVKKAEKAKEKVSKA